MRPPSFDLVDVYRPFGSKSGDGVGVTTRQGPDAAPGALSFLLWHEAAFLYPTFTSRDIDCAIASRQLAGDARATSGAASASVTPVAASNATWRAPLPNLPPVFIDLLRRLDGCEAPTDFDAVAGF